MTAPIDTEEDDEMGSKLFGEAIYLNRNRNSSYRARSAP